MTHELFTQPSIISNSDQIQNIGLSERNAVTFLIVFFTYSKNYEG